MVSLFRGKTPKIKNACGEVIPESIALLEKQTIGGITQWLLIRGHNTNNPLLLFLHGGPGSSEMGFAYKFERNLEKHFVFVNWDQRGTAKTFSRRTPKESMNIEQFIADAHEVIIHLLKRFNQKKLFLVGHSWGSVMGVILSQRYPELIHAYVGIGQVVNMVLNEKISHAFTMEEAKKAGNKRALKQLTKLQPPYYKALNQLRIQRKWMNRFGGALYGKKSVSSLLKVSFGAPEYSLRDIVKFMMGALFSLRTMWEENCRKINFLEDIRELKVPVYFIAGRMDYNTPFELVEQYYRKLKAPKKEFIWFERSAHSPNCEEPEKFDKVLIEKVLTQLKESKKRK